MTRPVNVFHPELHTVADVQAWIKRLGDLDWLSHPDDDPRDVVVNATGTRLWNDLEADHIEAAYSRAFRVLSGTNHDIYRMCLDLSNETNLDNIGYTGQDTEPAALPALSAPIGVEHTDAHLHTGHGWDRGLRPEHLAQAMADHRRIHDTAICNHTHEWPSAAEAVAAPAGIFAFKVTDRDTTYQPWTDGRALGFKVTRADGKVGYIYINPATMEEGELPAVFVYGGPAGGVAGQDPSLHFYDLDDSFFG